MNFNHSTWRSSCGFFRKPFLLATANRRYNPLARRCRRIPSGAPASVRGNQHSSSPRPGSSGGVPLSCPAPPSACSSFAATKKSPPLAQSPGSKWLTDPGNFSLAAIPVLGAGPVSIAHDHRRRCRQTRLAARIPSRSSTLASPLAPSAPGPRVCHSRRVQRAGPHDPRSPWPRLPRRGAQA